MGACVGYLFAVLCQSFQEDENFSSMLLVSMVVSQSMPGTFHDLKAEIIDQEIFFSSACAACGG